MLENKSNIVSTFTVSTVVVSIYTFLMLETTEAHGKQSIITIFRILADFGSKAIYLASTQNVWKRLEKDPCTTGTQGDDRKNINR